MSDCPVNEASCAENRRRCAEAIAALLRGKVSWRVYMWSTGILVLVVIATLAFANSGEGATNRRVTKMDKEYSAHVAQADERSRNIIEKLGSLEKQLAEQTKVLRALEQRLPRRN